MKISFSGADDDSLNAATLEITKEAIEIAKIQYLKDVISYIYKNEPRAHKSFYKPDGSLASGTICLVDEQDAEMRGPEEQDVTESSVIVFISTLHGG